MQKKLSREKNVLLTRVARFFLVQHTKIYQITIKNTKWPQNIPNGIKIDQQAIKQTNIFKCKYLWKIPKLGFLVQKSGKPVPLSDRYYKTAKKITHNVV
jgi:hypothetical protein